MSDNRCSRPIFLPMKKMLNFVFYLMAMFYDGKSSNTTISSSDDMQVDDDIYVNIK